MRKRAASSSAICAERTAQVNGASVSENGVKIDDAYGVSQVIKDEIGDFEIPVDKLLRLVGNDERRQRRDDVVSDTAHLIRQLGMHVLQFCEDKIRIVEVRDAALRYVITCCQVLMQKADEASCRACHGRVWQALEHMAWQPGIYPPAPTAHVVRKRLPV
jgi:hypothetical protein